MVQQSSAIAIFCCYARIDIDLLDELKTHLSPLQRQNVINVWHDGDISAGTEWDQEIKKHLKNAKIILLLISPDFIKSDYCYSTEMQHALEQHKQGDAKVIPVILRPVNGWKKVPSGDIQLGQLQALPKDAKPVTSWTNHDEAWIEVVEGIEKVVSELLIRESVPSVKPRPSILRRSVVAGLTGSAVVGGISALFWTHVFPFSLGVPDSTVTPTQPKQAVQKWVFTTEGSVGSSPTVVNGVLYVGSDDHKVYAINVNTGHLIWAFPTGDKVSSSPTVADGVLYVGSQDSFVYAIDTVTGKKKWAFPTGDAVYSPPTVVNDVLYIGSNDNKVYAIDTSTGQKIWAFPIGAPISSWSRMINGVLYFASLDSSVYAIDTSTGQKIWAFSTGAPVQSSAPAVANGVLYVGSNNHKVYAIDARTGQKKWAFLTGNAVFSSPIVVNGVLYVGSNDHKVYAINANTGQEKWTFSTSDAVYCLPAVVNGVLYVSSWDSSVYAIDTSTGRQQWVFTTEGSIFSSPTVVDGVLYVGSLDSSVYALMLPR